MTPPGICTIESFLRRYWSLSITSARITRTEAPVLTSRRVSLKQEVRRGQWVGSLEMSSEMVSMLSIVFRVAIVATSSLIRGTSKGKEKM